MGNGFFVPIISGGSKDPVRTCELIKEEIERRKQVGFEEHRFKNIQKMYYASLIKSLGNAESLATALINAGLRRAGDAFSPIDAIASITCEDVRKFLCERFDVDNSSLYVIKPVPAEQTEE